jgi:hypothetical protein
MSGSRHDYFNCLTVYVKVPKRNTIMGMTIFGCPTIQFRIACAFIGCSKDVCNFVTAFVEGTASPCMQLCAVAAERTWRNVTTVERNDPAAPDVDGVRSDILPNG